MSLLPDFEFNKCVARNNGDYRIKEFTCKEHFFVMSFVQLTYQDSLREIESCLRAMSKKLYHSVIKKLVARNTLAKANERRNWRNYVNFAQVMIAAISSSRTRKCNCNKEIFTIFFLIGYYQPSLQIIHPCRAINVGTIFILYSKINSSSYGFTVVLAIFGYSSEIEDIYGVITNCRKVILLLQLSKIKRTIKLNHFI